MQIGRRTAVAAIGAAVAACTTRTASYVEPRPRVSPNARPTILTAAPAVDGQGARVFRLFPQRGADHHDPFVLLDDFRVAPPAGFPTHPHRGFEAFTYMLDGAFHHTDTLGNDSIVTTGGTQRFTSGRGAYHSEMPGAPQINRGLQLWVNLPSALKRIDPEYEAVHAPDLPTGGRGGFETRTVAGRGSPVSFRIPVEYADVRARARGEWQHEIAEGHRGLVYVTDGLVKVGDLEVRETQAALVQAGELGVRAEPGSRFVLIAGLALDEPIRQRGPYVD